MEPTFHFVKVEVKFNRHERKLFLEISEWFVETSNSHFSRNLNFHFPRNFELAFFQKLNSHFPRNFNSHFPRNLILIFWTSNQLFFQCDSTRVDDGNYLWAWSACIARWNLSTQITANKQWTNSSLKRQVRWNFVSLAACFRPRLIHHHLILPCSIYF
jgi:hypothetical protein